MKRIGLILLFLFIGAFLHSQTSIWKMFDADQFSLQFPTGWKIQEISSDFKNADVQFLAIADQENSTDKFQENLNLIVENLQDATIDLKAYAKKSEDAIKKNIEGLKMFHKKTSVFEAGECFIFQYHGKLSANDLFWYQVYWVKDAKAYVLTLTSDEKSHWDFKRAFEVIAQSFIIK